MISKFSLVNKTIFTTDIFGYIFFRGFLYNAKNNKLFNILGLFTQQKVKKSLSIRFKKNYLGTNDKRGTSRNVFSWYSNWLRFKIYLES